MGGFRSGTWFRCEAKSVIEDFKKIDISILKSKELQGRAISNHVVFSYYIQDERDNSEKFEYPVFLTWTNCHYGNARPWFICPGTIRGKACNRRVAALYLRNKYYLCRHCHNLSYQSRNENAVQRMHRKAQKIRQRLQGNENLSVPMGFKPKGMHWVTFEQLLKQEERINYFANELVYKRLNHYIATTKLA